MRSLVHSRVMETTIRLRIPVFDSCSYGRPLRAHQQHAAQRVSEGTSQGGEIRSNRCEAVIEARANRCANQDERFCNTSGGNESVVNTAVTGQWFAVAAVCDRRLATLGARRYRYSC
jgi:hypothetical protein